MPVPDRHQTEGNALRVLAPSPDRELAALRREVLVLAGFDVSSAITKADAIKELKQSNFDILILCYEWGEADMQQFADFFKQRNPSGCTIALIEMPGDNRAPFADAGVRAVDGPAALIQTIRECFQKTRVG